MRSLTARVRKVGPRIAFAIPPLLLLGIDFLLYPKLFEGFDCKKPIAVGSLLIHENLKLGIFRAHSILISIDDIRAINYLDRIKGEEDNALVLSVFADEKGSNVVPGALVSAVTERLHRLSPGDAQGLIDRLRAENNLSPGQVITFELHIPESKRTQFPVKYLLVAVLPYSAPGKMRESLLRTLPQVFNLAGERRVSNLVLPCLATNWENKNSLTFDEFFSAFFEALPTNTDPNRIHISFYTEWPTFYLEAAVSSLNANWLRSYAKVYDNFPQPYQADIRLILILLFICLLVVSYSVATTVRNWAAVVFLFVGAAAASEKAVIELLQGRGPATVLAFKFAVLTILALEFRRFTIWNPRNVFKR